jgi:hypothetical protein
MQVGVLAILEVLSILALQLNFLVTRISLVENLVSVGSRGYRVPRVAEVLVQGQHRLVFKATDFRSQISSIFDLAIFKVVNLNGFIAEQPVLHFFFLVKIGVTEFDSSADTFGGVALHQEDFVAGKLEVAEVFSEIDAVLCIALKQICLRPRVFVEIVVEAVFFSLRKPGKPQAVMLPEVIFQVVRTEIVFPNILIQVVGSAEVSSSALLRVHQLNHAGLVSLGRLAF